VGVFDYVNCKYPLPVPGTQDLEYQTKDTPEQYLESYEIREDGTLWCLDKVREWRVDPTALLGGYLDTISEAWRQLADFTGELRLIASYGPPASSGAGINWITYSAYFVRGQLKHLETVSSEVAP
jgi:hypothetical protein